MTKNLPKLVAPARDLRELNTRPKLIAVIAQQYCRLVGVQHQRQQQQQELIQAASASIKSESDCAVTASAE